MNFYYSRSRGMGTKSFIKHTMIDKILAPKRGELLEAFDLETYVGEEGELIPYCLSYTCKDKIINCYGTDCVKKFLEELDRSTIYYAHNLNFDGTFILWELTKTEVWFQTFMLNASIYYIKIPKIDVEFKCSYKLFPMSLKKASKILNTSEKSSFDHKLVNSLNFNEDTIKEKAILYCNQDVKVTKELIIKYNKNLSPLTKK